MSNGAQHARTGDGFHVGTRARHSGPGLHRLRVDGLQPPTFLYATVGQTWQISNGALHNAWQIREPRSNFEVGHLCALEFVHGVESSAAAIIRLAAADVKKDNIETSPQVFMIAQRRTQSGREAHNYDCEIWEPHREAHNYTLRDHTGKRGPQGAGDREAPTSNKRQSTRGTDTEASTH